MPRPADPSSGLPAPTPAAAIKQEARRLGFDLCRITPATEAPHADFFDAWAEAGRAGAMRYLERNRERRRFPARLAQPPSPPFQSLIVLAADYHRFDLPPTVLDDPSRGIVARYAWGDDYHEVVRPLLFELDAFIRRATGRATLGKCLVDSGPVLERDWAQRAGLGFTGKNTCTIHPQRGSWLLLATVLVPEMLEADPPPPATGSEPSPAAVLAGLEPRGDYGAWQLEAGRGTCGRCTRCLHACPTDAFTGPFHLNPLRCISYWTIETQAPIPPALRPAFGNRIFGCDVCQEVCPWNARLAERTPLLAGLAAQAGRVAPPLLEGFDPAHPYWLDADAFAARFRRSPIKRAKRAGMLRNVCVALGNWADPAALPALARALEDPEPGPRGHAAWALGRVARSPDGEAARALLAARLSTEMDGWVRDEIAAALAGGVR